MIVVKLFMLFCKIVKIKYKHQNQPWLLCNMIWAAGTTVAFILSHVIQRATTSIELTWPTICIMSLGYQVKEKVIYIVYGIKLHVYMYFNKGCHTHCLIFNMCILSIFCFGQVCLINVAFLNFVNCKTEPLWDGFSRVDESNCFLFFQALCIKSHRKMKHSFEIGWECTCFLQ